MHIHSRILVFRYLKVAVSDTHIHVSILPTPIFVSTYYRMCPRVAPRSISVLKCDTCANVYELQSLFMMLYSCGGFLRVKLLLHKILTCTAHHAHTHTQRIAACTRSERRKQIWTYLQCSIPYS